MTMQGRQSFLTAQMKRKKSWGQEEYCARCWACYHEEACIATGKARTVQALCAKAEQRLKETQE